MMEQSSSSNEQQEFKSNNNNNLDLGVNVLEPPRAQPPQPVLVAQPPSQPPPFWYSSALAALACSSMAAYPLPMPMLPVVNPLLLAHQFQANIQKQLLQADDNNKLKHHHQQEVEISQPMTMMMTPSPTPILSPDFSAMILQQQQQIQEKFRQQLLIEQKHQASSNNNQQNVPMLTTFQPLLASILQQQQQLLQQQLLAQVNNNSNKTGGNLTSKKSSTSGEVGSSRKHLQRGKDGRFVGSKGGKHRPNLRYPCPWCSIENSSNNLARHMEKGRCPKAPRPLPSIEQMRELRNAASIKARHARQLKKGKKRIVSDSSDASNSMPYFNDESADEAGGDETKSKNKFRVVVAEDESNNNDETTPPNSSSSASSNLLTASDDVKPFVDDYASCDFILPDNVGSDDIESRLDNFEPEEDEEDPIFPVDFSLPKALKKEF